jgi:hypothetical protein
MWAVNAARAGTGRDRWQDYLSDAVVAKGRAVSAADDRMPRRPIVAMINRSYDAKR